MNILTVNLVFSTLIFWIAAKIYILPQLDKLEPRVVMLPILILHSLRHLGLMFLASGATYSGMPANFAYPAAFGDLVTALLAISAIPAVFNNTKYAKQLVFLFNVVGILDLLLAIVLGTIYDAAPYMGAAYWIPAFWVPALLVTHYITFLLLRKHWPAIKAVKLRK